MRSVLLKNVSFSFKLTRIFQSEICGVRRSSDGPEQSIDLVDGGALVRHHGQPSVAGLGNAEDLNTFKN